MNHGKPGFPIDDAAGAAEDADVARELWASAQLSREGASLTTMRRCVGASGATPLADVGRELGRDDLEEA